jgi:hypothetical protein
VIGCTAWARRIVSGAASLSPMRRILPASTCSARAPTVSSIGVPGWGPRVHAVLVVEVDVIDAEPAERAVDRAAHVLGAAVGRPVHLIVVGDPELRRDHELVALAGDRLADELLVGAAAVHLGGVQEIDAELERAVDRRRRLFLVGLAVEGGHAHAAEPERRYLQRGRAASKCSVVHRVPSVASSVPYPP